MKRHSNKKAKYYGGVKLKNTVNPVANSLEESSGNFTYSSNTTSNTNPSQLNIPQPNIHTFNKPNHSTQSLSHNNSQIIQNNNPTFYSNNSKPKSNKKMKPVPVSTAFIPKNVKPTQENNHLNFNFQTQQPISLENEWTIWFDNFKEQEFTPEAYLNSMVPLGSFGTIQVNFLK